MSLAREPLTVVELKQPLCSRSYGLLPCTAGMGTRSSGTGFERDFSTDAAAGYGATDGTLTVSGGVANLLGTGADPYIRTSSTEVGFTGDDFRYVVVHGKWNAGTTKQFQMYYSTNIGWANNRSMFAVNLNSSFRGVTLANIEVGQEFVAVFDAADSTDYATSWLGANVNRFRFDFAGSDTDVDIYSIQIGTESLITNTATACKNTWATCQDIVNIDMSEEVSLFFVESGANRPVTSGFAPLLDSNGNIVTTEEGDIIEVSVDPSQQFQPSTAMPLLRSVDTSPSVLNVSGGDRDIEALGGRAVATVVIGDSAYNDVGIDPYVDDRGYDVEARGTLFGRWLASNPYHSGYDLFVHEGYRGYTLEAMTSRQYSIDAINRSTGFVQITSKDILRKITDNKVKLPAPSPGVLALDITASQAAIEIAGASPSDYPAPGWVRIGDEVIAFAAVSETGTNIQLTGCTRGQINTTADTHPQEDKVQWVLAYVNEPFQDILYDIQIRSGIPAAFIPKADWDQEKLEWRELYNLTSYITEPNEARLLSGDLLEQAQSHMWWDERVPEIKMNAQRANPPPATLSESDVIVADSYSEKEDTSARVTTVMVYFGLRSPVHDAKSPSGYRSASRLLDVEALAAYGEESVREIFAYWIDSQVLADSLAGRYLARFKNIRKRITFDVTAKDVIDHWTGDVAKVRHWMLQDPLGNYKTDQWLITSAEPVEPGAVYRFTAEDNEGAGLVWELVADSDIRPSTEIGAWVDEDGTDGAGNELPYRWL